MNEELKSRVAKAKAILAAQYQMHDIIILFDELVGEIERLEAYEAIRKSAEVS